MKPTLHSALTFPAVLLSFAVLAGCSTPARVPPERAAAPLSPVDGCGALLRGLADESTADDAGFQIQLLERSLTAAYRDDAQLRLAWLLARPGASIAEERRAMPALERLLTGGGPADPCLHGAAVLLRGQLLARQRLRTALDDERRQRELLSIQVEELKAIERRISDRARVPAPESAATPEPVP